MESNWSGPLFIDRTATVFENEREIIAGQLSIGIERWVQQLEAYQNVYQFGHNGLSIGDVNGDGLDDVYSCQVGGLPNRLFIAAEDGTVRDIAAVAGVDFLDNTRAALLVDLDNDADQDLVLTFPASTVVLANDGRARFTLAARFDKVRHAFSLAASDFDQDGDLDLFACRYYAFAGTREHRFFIGLRNGAGTCFLK